MRTTNSYSVRIEVKDGEVEEILKRLEEAQEEIFKCYNRLQDIGVLTVIPNDKRTVDPPDRGRRGHGARNGSDSRCAGGGHGIIGKKKQKKKLTASGRKQSTSLKNGHIQKILAFKDGRPYLKDL